MNMVIDPNVQKLDELEERMRSLPGFKTEIKLDLLRQRLEHPEFKDYMYPTALPIVLRQLEQEVMSAEILRANIIECGIRSARRLLNEIARGGQYALTRNDGEPMGMGEQIYLGNILEAMEAMVKATGNE